MERIEIATAPPVLRGEHEARYRWAARFARGQVLDAACGTGYGAGILLKADSVHSYHGIDISLDALPSDSTQETLSNEVKKPVAFSRCDCTSLDELTTGANAAQFDTIVSLETLEHLPNYQAAIECFAKHLAEPGLLLCSVPMPEFDEQTAEVYGVNEFHIHRISQSSLEQELHKHFPYIFWMTQSVEMGCRILPYFHKDKLLPVITGRICGPAVNGSLLCIATRDADTAEKIRNTLADAIEVTMFESQVEYDKRWRDTYKFAEARIAALDEAYATSVKMVQKRDDLIRQQDKIVADRDELIRQQDAIVADRDNSIMGLSNRLADFEQAFARAEEMIRERDALIRQMEDKLNSRGS